jgi:integrase
MKKVREHVVPLPRPAQALLEEIERTARAENSPWVFPQTTTPQRAIGENRMLYCLYDLGFKGIATVHGFRGLASAVVNEQVNQDGTRRFDADWIELQLAHVEANAVRGAYNSAQYIVPTTSHDAVVGELPRRPHGGWAAIVR